MQRGRAGKGWEWGGGTRRREAGRRRWQQGMRQQGGRAKGRGRRGEGAKGWMISQMDMMECLGGYRL